MLKKLTLPIALLCSLSLLACTLAWMFRGAGEQMAYALGTNVRPDIARLAGIMLHPRPISDPYGRLRQFGETFRSAQPGISRFEESVKDAKALEDEPDQSAPATTTVQSVLCATPVEHHRTSSSSDSKEATVKVAGPAPGYLRAAVVAWIVNAARICERLPLFVFAIAGGYIVGLLAARARRRRTRFRNLPASYFAHRATPSSRPRRRAHVHTSHAHVAPASSRFVPSASARRFIEI